MVKKVECGACGATGLYCGFAEPKGTAVICLNCKGTGARDGDDIPAKYHTPFTGRKRREGIHTVSQSQGSLIAFGVGAKKGTTMTYEEFLRRFPDDGELWGDSWEQ